MTSWIFNFNIFILSRKSRINLIASCLVIFPLRFLSLYIALIVFFDFFPSSKRLASIVFINLFLVEFWLGNFSNTLSNFIIWIFKLALGSNLTFCSTNSSGLFKNSSKFLQLCLIFNPAIIFICNSSSTFLNSLNFSLKSSFARSTCISSSVVLLSKIFSVFNVLYSIASLSFLLLIKDDSFFLSRSSTDIGVWDKLATFFFIFSFKLKFVRWIGKPPDFWDNNVESRLSPITLWGLLRIDLFVGETIILLIGEIFVVLSAYVVLILEFISLGSLTYNFPVLLK